MYTFIGMILFLNFQVKIDIHTVSVQVSNKDTELGIKTLTGIPSRPVNPGVPVFPYC